MKILLITTGGTIACDETENGLSPILKGGDLLKYADDSSDIEVLDFKLIDSSVMTDDDRDELCQVIFDNKDKYDSFIITHGTDSLSYTAAYLDCALENFDKSIILTGSQKPIVYEVSDATENLNLAIQTAKDGYYGICVAMFNTVISARYVTKIETEWYNSFESVDRDYLRGPIPLKEKAEIIKKTPANKKIGILYITPLLEKEDILKYDSFNDVIVLVLGAGGMLNSQYEALVSLLKKGVNIHLKSQCLFGNVQAVYAAHESVKQFNILPKASLEWVLYALKFDVI